MKSIKEKAEESSLGCDEVQAAAMGRGFVLGANYVLEQIEEALNKALDNLSIKDGYLEARKCIEQLKDK
jgi:hypothetical protein